MKFGSVCSGIEAASVAWETLGWDAEWLCEIDKFPSAVLAHHYPEKPNYGDMTKLPEMVANGEVTAPDVLVGGTPCQSFSVAGARKGLEDERGQLTIKFVELANEIDKRRLQNGQSEATIIWENVPGVLSSKDNAFGAFLGFLSGEECELQPPGGKWKNAGVVHGPQRSIAWRVLDAQYFGVAQRRRRVFVVASAAKGFSPDKVLFESEGVRRDIKPSRTQGEGIASDAEKGAGGASVYREGSFGQYVEGEFGTLTASGGVLSGGSETFCLFKNSIVRKLTPIECERLQGFPDNYTQIPWRNKSPEDCPDGPRYKALGNSMAVPVMRWIAKRVMMQTAANSNEAPSVREVVNG